VCGVNSRVFKINFIIGYRSLGWGWGWVWVRVGVRFGLGLGLRLG